MQFVLRGRPLGRSVCSPSTLEGTDQELSGLRIVLSDAFAHLILVLGEGWEFLYSCLYVEVHLHLGGVLAHGLEFLDLNYVEWEEADEVTRIEVCFV